MTRRSVPRHSEDERTELEKLHMTVHAGLLQEHPHLTMGRITGIVSRGGSLIARWMTTHKQ